MESEILDKMHRRIVQNFLDVVILLELRKHPLRGYDVISFVKNKFDILLSSGIVHSHLYGMERDGLINGEGTQGKRTYTLTEHGRETAKTFLNAKDKILGLILNIFVGV